MITKAAFSIDHHSRLTLRSFPYRAFSLLQVPAVLALMFIAFWAFWRCIVGRQSIATVVDSKISRKEPSSGSNSAGSLRREELDPGPLDDLENQGTTHFHDDFIAVRYEESLSVRRDGGALTGSRKQLGEATLSQSSSRHRGEGEDIEDGGSMFSSPPSIGEVLQRSLRGFREPWWTAPASGENETREDEANLNLGSH